MIITSIKWYVKYACSHFHEVHLYRLLRGYNWEKLCFQVKAAYSSIYVQTYCYYLLIVKFCLVHEEGTNSRIIFHIIDYLNASTMYTNLIFIYVIRYHVVNVLTQFCALTIISGWVYHYAHIFYFVGKVFLCLTKQKYKNNMIYKDNKYEPSKRYTNNIISLEF